MTTLKHLLRMLIATKVLRAQTIMTKKDQFDTTNINPSTIYKIDENTMIEEIIPISIKREMHYECSR